MTTDAQLMNHPTVLLLNDAWQQPNWLKVVRDRCAPSGQPGTSLPEELSPPAVTVADAGLTCR